ncbi:PEPxxWA-CTERM sorting domain-containing protein [Sphingomonas sp. KR1UV-12]|uniref:PEPxxWA-CTERM sorting domain-containing protein n=1 Tax=Sphingomonas aurea TaxID=3063994 RepID=A0ABT9EI55_9SPHN|nr:PEPxxWA-CTERM sorting domain-containing protein [Sphingomonas sp. KR1UV-12]MDP1026525.1 PEPxxWA-CTERM sorting domain-containing protein [Sphingomonas sp. KR1UV-12]
MKKIALAAVTAAAAFAAVPAAAVTFQATDGSTTVFNASAVGAQYSFETSTTGNTGNPTGFVRTGGSVMSGSSAGVGANPFGAGSDNSYLYVQAGVTSTISAITTAITGYQNISFYMGSIDAGNTVQLLGAGGAVLKSYTGSDLAAPASAQGQQTLPGTNRLLSFTAGAGEVLTGIRFTSTVNSLEADNVRFTAAVPEPATWAMMMLGFAMVGAGMRYRSRKSAVKFVTA